MTIKIPKKLIEVALPLDVINNEAGRRKRKAPGGYPTTLHKWWAQRPLAAARAVLFAQLVNDPGYERHLGRGVNKQRAWIERERLFEIIRKLVDWENTKNSGVLDQARNEILKSWRETCDLNRNHPRAAELFNPDAHPPFLDPFAGSGAIPLEAQRLGLESNASDLNPVAFFINKAMIEIPPKFAGMQPIGPMPPSDKQQAFVREWEAAEGLAEDVRRYGIWMQNRAFKRISHLYPDVDLPAVHGGGKAKVVAWLWARTVSSPNPAYSGLQVPLVSNYILSSKVGKEVYVSPIVEGDSYTFKVIYAHPPASAKNGTKVPGKGANFYCIFSNSLIDGKHIKAEAQAGRMGVRLMAIVAAGPRGRVYLSPDRNQEEVAKLAIPDWRPSQELMGKARDQLPLYGMNDFGSIFTARQLVLLNTLIETLAEVRTEVENDALKAGWSDDQLSLENEGSGAKAYSEAIAVYLACAISRAADYGCSAATWRPKDNAMRSGMPKQAIQMNWDFAEGSAFASSSAGFQDCVLVASKVLAAALGPGAIGHATQRSALESAKKLAHTTFVLSTDPPYYDNISYADLSDFFYVWLRRSVRDIYPKLFETLLVPKEEELVATTYRHNSAGEAEKFFLDGMTQAMSRMTEHAHPAFPTTIYYAFKQSETTDIGTGNTGWETFLEAVLRAGFAISGTWPIRTESDNRQMGIGANALASSIVLVCRKRDENAVSISRREFLREMKDELSEAVEVMIGGAEGVSPVQPVDLAQAVIGPGMAIFSKYSAVLESDGGPMTVHTALTLINRMLIEGGDDFDADTQFCLSWFDEQGWAAGEFGKADVLARAKGTSVDGVRESGVVEAGSGKVRLLKPSEYPTNWNPEEDNRTPVWEALHQMILALRTLGESAAGILIARMPQRAEPIRNLAYRLYTLCERKGWAEDARAYNELITSWTGIEAASHEKGHFGSQANLEI